MKFSNFTQNTVLPREFFLKRWGKFMLFFSLPFNFSSVKSFILSFSLFLVIYCFLLNQRNLESTKKLLVLLDMLLVASCAEKEQMAKCTKHGVKMVVRVSEMSHFSCSHHISLNVLWKTYDCMLNTRNHDKQQLKSHTASHSYLIKTHDILGCIDSKDRCKDRFLGEKKQ